METAHYSKRKCTLVETALQHDEAMILASFEGVATDSGVEMLLHYYCLKSCQKSWRLAQQRFASCRSSEVHFVLVALDST